MSIIKLKPIKHLFILLLLVIISASNNCLAQTVPCEERIDSIRKEYENGEWSICRDDAIRFMGSLKPRDYDKIRSKLPEECKNNIPNVYLYLIKSLLRLYDIEQARHYYFEALKNEFKIGFDNADNEKLLSFGRLKNYSFSLKLESVSPNFKEYKILNEFKIGAMYGFKSNSYLELSYMERAFIQSSDHHPGLFGKTLKNQPGIFPNYSFLFRGNDRLIDLTYSYRKLINQNNGSLNYLYFSGGAYVNYYLNSHVNGYEIIIRNGGGADTIRPVTTSPRYTRIDVQNVHMDLDRLYKERFNFGVFLGYGSNTRLSNKWELTLEGRLTIGMNYRYNYAVFRDYKVGVDYFTIMVGITRRYNKITEYKIL